MHESVVAEAGPVIVLEIKGVVGAPGSVPGVPVGYAVAQAWGDDPMSEGGEGHRGNRRQVNRRHRGPGKKWQSAEIL
jgi:hypothetical protein